jgi:S1-C subfamily serine protease
VSARLTILSGARLGQVETFHKAYIAVGRHPLSDLRFDVERDLEVASRHAAIVRQGPVFVLRDLGSANGTFVNGHRLSGDVTLADGDVIGFGPTGPTIEFHVTAAAPEPEVVSPAGRASAERLAGPGEPYRAVDHRHTPPGGGPPSRRLSTAARVAAEVARQTRQLRRTTKVLLALLGVALAAFAWVEGTTAREARELIRLEGRADSASLATQQLMARFQSELASVRDALERSQAEVAVLRHDLATANAKGDAGAVARLRAALDAAAARQRGLAGAVAVDYRAISRQNQDAVALLVVEYSDSERFSGTAFAVDSQGTLVTTKHVLAGEAGDRRPLRIAVKFSGSRQWFPARLVGVADLVDVGAVAVDVRGGTPRVAGFSPDAPSLERGDPVAIIGYPLGEALPMERLGESGVIADPTLTVGTVSKVLSDLIQVDGYGAPGSSGSPIFDRQGRVAAVVFGGNRESQGKIIYAVPGPVVVAYLRTLSAR